MDFNKINSEISANSETTISTFLEYSSKEKDLYLGLLFKYLLYCLLIVLAFYLIRNASLSDIDFGVLKIKDAKVIMIGLPIIFSYTLFYVIYSFDKYFINYNICSICVKRLLKLDKSSELLRFYSDKEGSTGFFTAILSLGFILVLGFFFFFQTYCCYYLFATYSVTFWTILEGLYSLAFLMVSIKRLIIFGINYNNADIVLHNS